MVPACHLLVDGMWRRSRSGRRPALQQGREPPFPSGHPVGGNAPVEPVRHRWAVPVLQGPSCMVGVLDRIPLNFSQASRAERNPPATGFRFSSGVRAGQAGTGGSRPGLTGWNQESIFGINGPEQVGNRISTGISPPRFGPGSETQNPRRRGAHGAGPPAAR